MSKMFRAAAALALIAGLNVMTAPSASATECNPKGCSGGCRLANPREAHIDLDTLTITMPQPIECYS